MRQIDKLILLTLVVSLLASCVTQKRKGELSALGKLYHNTTAKFNGYFNANELLEESILKLNDQHQDNYREVLPIYEYVAVDNADLVAADLDRAIEKVSVVVNLHRESHWTDDCYLLVGKAQYLKQDYESAEETLRYFIDEFSPEKMREKERGKKGKKDKADGDEEEDDEEIDVSELSEKEKRRLEKQQEKERKRYNRELRKKRKDAQKRRKRAQKNSKKAEKEKAKREEEERKKALAEAQQKAEEEAAKAQEAAEEAAREAKEAAEAQQPENYFLKHRPVYQEGLLWLARTYVERERYDEALRLLAQLEGDSKTFPDIRESMALVQAHLYLRQEKYIDAVTPLEEAIAITGKRTDKARYAFIIAQIYNRAGRRNEAYAAFQRALKFGPEYSMEFNGRLFLVENGWRAGTYSTPEARSELDRMLRDIKNEEYKDQIYYALAEIDLESGNRKEGIENLKNSVAFSRQNVQQKGESYLRLANLYLEEEDFIPAQRYFDSTLMALPQSDERYAEAQRWRDNLTDIAANLEIIAYQDSLLAIAALSPEEQRALAFKIKKERDEQRLRDIAASANAGGGQQGNVRRPVGTNVALTSATGSRAAPGAEQSEFFAYDDREIKRGKRDFFREWGGRPLEDDWRRSSKSSAGGNLPVADIPDQPAASALPEDEINSILAEVPKTDGEILETEMKVQDALYKLGTLYRDRLGNNAKTVEALETLNRRFSGSNYELDSWYYLHLAHKDLSHPAEAQRYADLITGKYASSPYAKVLTNPNYLAEVKAEENRLSHYYDETFAAFTSGNYQQAYQRSLQAAQLFGAQNPMQAKFALLTAMSTGNLQGKEAYVNSLKDLIARYPDTPEQKRAREILRLLGESQASLPGRAVEETAGQFKVTDDQLHYILIVFNEDIRLNDSKVSVSNYNLEFHKLDKLRISNIYLGTEAETRIPILVIRRFQNKEEAMAYYEGARRNSREFIDPAIDYDIFAVSQNNYREILRSKSLGDYQAFFEEYYLGN